MSKTNALWTSGTRRWPVCADQAALNLKVARDGGRSYALPAGRIPLPRNLERIPCLPERSGKGTV